jgi:sugar phosphate isomerase/epimerase
MMENASKLILGAITDEFSPDLTVAAAAMAESNLTGAELRMVGSRNVVELSIREVREVKQLLCGHGIEVAVIAAPLLKCKCPGTEKMEEGVIGDIFGSDYSFAEQKDLAERSFEVANEAGARIVRAFSFWKVPNPASVFERIVVQLRALAELAERSGLIIGLENETACNVATSSDAAKMVSAVDHPNLQVVWDPANSYASGQRAFPEGYESIPFSKLAHVHVKDCRVINGSATWSCLGDGAVEWKQILNALVRQRFAGRVHLETHWTGATGDKLEASRVCAGILQDLVRSAQADVIQKSRSHTH